MCSCMMMVRVIHGDSSCQHHTTLISVTYNVGMSIVYHIREKFLYCHTCNKLVNHPRRSNKDILDADTIGIDRAMRCDSLNKK